MPDIFIWAEFGRAQIGSRGRLAVATGRRSQWVSWQAGGAEWVRTGARAARAGGEPILEQRGRIISPETTLHGGGQAVEGNWQ
jgi:hypothetical protein